MALALATSPLLATGARAGAVGTGATLGTQACPTVTFAFARSNVRETVRFWANPWLFVGSSALFIEFNQEQTPVLLVMHKRSAEV